MKRKCGVVSLLILLFLFVSPRDYGQIFFGITPIRAEYSGNPGESITDVFYVRNNASSPIRLKVFSENWTLKHDGTPAFIGSEPVSFSCKDWIKVNPQDFRLMPDEVKAVRYTVTIPENMESAGYHASVSFESVPDISPEKKSSRMLFTGKIAAAVYVSVGKIVPSGEILDARAEGEADSTFIILLMKNSGRTHFRIKGQIEIRDAGNEKALEAEVPNEVVLPESEREVKCRLPRKLAPGSYRAVVKLDIGRDELLGYEKEFGVKQ